MAALDYICCRGVAHRDLKLENLLLASPDDITDIKVKHRTLMSVLPVINLVSASI
jgi:serine/threonine protein kinase